MYTAVERRSQPLLQRPASHIPANFYDITDEMGSAMCTLPVLEYTREDYIYS